MADIFTFCFASGLVADRNEWADMIWYKNLVGEKDPDALYLINDLKHELKGKAYYGDRTGGSTIQLPFGFVQWHSPQKTIPGCLQFHHGFDKLSNL